MGEVVTYAEQKEMGLIRKQREAFVQGEVLPPDRKLPSIPVVVDPYADHISKAHMVAENTVDPIVRYRAVVKKVDRVTIFLAVLTGCLMLMFKLYPSEWGLWAFVLWIAIASAEWLAAGAFLSIMDYKETPAAQTWYKMKSLVGFMNNEQEHRLRHLYPDQYDERGRRKWQ